MVRSAAAALALMILPSFAPAQTVATGQDQLVHEVVRGETLWALAGRYLNDPFRWPLIYEANTDKIQDPHWIYPGQRFVIPGIPAPAAAAQPAEVRDVEVVSPQQPAAAPSQAPRPAAVDRTLEPCPAPDGRTIFYPGPGGERGCDLVRPGPDERTAFFPVPEEEIGGALVTAEATLWRAVPRGMVYGAPWLEPFEAEVSSLGNLQRLAEAWPERAMPDRAMGYEKVYVTPATGVELRVGDVLQTFRVTRAEEGFGQVVQPTGIITVTDVEEGGVVAAVAAEFDRVRIGDGLRRAPTYDLELGVHPEPVESNVVATVVGFPEDRELYGFGAMVFVDVGEAEGIAVGDEFRALVNQGEGYSGLEAVRLQAVRVDEEGSTLRVITMNEPVLKVGTELHLVGKMR